MNHLHTKKYHRVSYIQIFLLLIMFYLYTVITFTQGQEVEGTVPPSEAPIVIQNEPQIIPEQPQAETVLTGEIVYPAPTEGMSGTVETLPSTGEILSGILGSLSGETVYNISGNAILPEQFTGELVSGENLTGELIVAGSGELLSGTYQSGEVISGENISVEETLTTGDIAPETSIGTFSPENITGLLLRLDADAYDSLVMNSNDRISTWLDKRQNGREAYMTEASRRPTYEKNIVSGHPAIYFDDIDDGLGTNLVFEAPYTMYVVYNVENPYLANTRVLQGLNNRYLGTLNHRLIHYASGGTVGEGSYGSPNFVIAGIRNAGTQAFLSDNGTSLTDNPMYTRSPTGLGLGTFGFTQDEPLGGYIAEVLIYDTSLATENRQEILQYLNDKYPTLTSHSLHTYGVKSDTGEVSQLTGQEEVSTGNIENIETGTIVPIPTETGTKVPEVVVESPPEIIQQTPNEPLTIVGGGSSQGELNPTSPPDNSMTEILTGQDEIVTGYFDRAYDKGTYDKKIIELQKLLTQLQLYTGALDGIYSDELINSIYRYQEQNGLLIGQENNMAVRGYLGPTTRKFFNQSYIAYQIYEITAQQQSQEQNISSGYTEPSTSDLSPFTGDILIPISGQETLDQIGILSGINTIVLFDPFANQLFFSGLLLETGFQSALSGFVYTSGTQIGLVFTTGTQKQITEYLQTMGYITGTMTLVPVTNKTLVGDTALDFAHLSGTLLVPVVLQSSNELSGQIAEVQIPEGAVLKTADGEQFTGELAPPVFEDPAIVEQQVNQDVISVIDVGNQDQHISFEDLSGNDLYATFRVPVPGTQVGDTVDVNYSEDGENRTYLSSVNVENIDGEPYAVFYANHFTTFYLGTTTGTFLINNDDIYTTGLNVTLNSDVTGATDMRFGNTIIERNAATWTGYKTGFNRTLTGAGGDEIKRVYAQFSGNGVVRGVSDSIIYDTNNVGMSSGLQLHLDGSTGGVRFLDLGPRNLAFTGVGGTPKTTWSGEEVIFLDGSSDYIENTSGFITAYPFTISAWVQPANVVGTKVIAMFGNSGTNTTYYGIQLVGANAVAVGRNTTARSSTSTVTLVANKRYHIIGVFASSTSRTIYVDNASPVSTTTTATFAATNPRRRVGRHPGSSTTNYFSGNIDEVRVYKKALNTGERQNLFMIPPTFDDQTAFTGTPTLYGELSPKMRDIDLVISGTVYHTTGAGSGEWKTVPMITGLNNGTYNVTLNYTSVYGDTGTVIYTGGLIIALPGSTGLHIDYNPTGVTSGNVIATLTGLDPTYMIVNNFGSEFYTFTGNDTFTWQYVDKQGTTGTIDATVDRIDTIDPTFAGVTSGAYYSGNKSITFSDTNLSGATLDGAAYTSGTTISTQGTHVFIVYDLAGNDTGATFTIDTTVPTFAGVTSGAQYSGNKSITFSDTNLSGATLNGSAYTSGTTISTQGTHVFIVYDLAGNDTGATFTIDTTVPTFAGVASGAYYSGNKSITFSDTNLSGATLDGSAYTSGTTISTQGTHVFIVIDRAGNDTGATFTIDTTVPTFAGVTSGGYYSGNKSITFSDTNLSGATLDGAAYTSGTTISTQGTHVFIVIDLAGNDTGATFTIDTTVPTFAGVTSGASYNSSKSITFSDTNLSGATLDGAAYTSGTTISAAGTHVFFVSDRAGNSTGATFTINAGAPTAISGPVNFDFNNNIVSDTVQTIVKTFSGASDYFKVIDGQGLDTGYYTTISISNMTNGSGDTVPYTAIAIKALTGIVTLNGTTNPRVYSAITGVYKYFTASPLTFIKRDTAANGGVVGTYGLYTVWKVDIPALQNIGNYTGMITYTLY